MVSEAPRLSTKRFYGQESPSARLLGHLTLELSSSMPLGPGTNTSRHGFDVVHRPNICPPHPMAQEYASDGTEAARPPSPTEQHYRIWSIRSHQRRRSRLGKSPPQYGRGYSHPPIAHGTLIPKPDAWRHPHSHWIMRSALVEIVRNTNPR